MGKKLLLDCTLRDGGYVNDWRFGHDDLASVFERVVDAGVDTGPILAQEAVPVLPADDEASLHERIKAVERRLLVDTLERLARHGWTVQGRKVNIP